MNFPKLSSEYRLVLIFCRGDLIPKAADDNGVEFVIAMAVALILSVCGRCTGDDFSVSGGDVKVVGTLFLKILDGPPNA